MTPIEPPTPPRKASWKRWIVAVACVAAITLAVLFLKAPTPEPVSVKFIGTTNYNGEKMLLFRATNGLVREIFIQAFVTDTFVDIDQFDNGTNPYYDRAMGVVAAGGTGTFLVRRLREGADPYVMWVVLDSGRVQTRGDKARAACFNFLKNHGMKTLARHFPCPPYPHYISPTDLKE